MTDIKKKVTEAAGERRHEARRTEDIANPRERSRHFLSGVVQRHPVLIAFAVALLVALVPVLMLLDQQTKIRAQANQITDLYGQLQLSRRATSRKTCDAINKNAIANNRTTDVITGFVIASTKQSRAFERAYHNLGLPPYKKRLAQARKLSHDLVRQKVPAIDCDAIVRQIDRELASAGLGHGSRDRLSSYPH